jgi:hypothetical protein
MRHPSATVAILAALATAPAFAQTAQPPLPAPMIDPNAPPRTFIEAARHALAAGRTEEAQEAIERAESRALDRAVKPSLARDPSRQPLVLQLSQARQALAAGDRMRAITLLDAAAGNPEAAGR